MNYQRYESLAGFDVLLRLQNIDNTQLMRMTEETPVEDLLIILKDINFMLKGECLYKRLFSINFFRFIIDLLERRLLTNPELARCLQETLVAAYTLHPEYRCTLQELGLGEALVEVLKREISGQDTDEAINSRRGDECAISCRLIASLFPRLQRAPYIDEVESIFVNSILYDSYFNDDFEIGEEVLAMLRVIFPVVIEVCRSRINCLSYDLLLLKLLFWAKRRLVLEHLANRKEIVDYVKSLLSSDQSDKVNVGMTLATQLSSKYPELFESDSIDDRAVAEQFMEEVRAPHVSRDDRSRLIRSMLEFIMLSENFVYSNYSLDYAKENHLVDLVMTERQFRLGTFVAVVLCMPRDVTKVKGKLIISPEGIRAFEHLVKFVVQAIEDAQADKENFEICTEMIRDYIYEGISKIPNSPAEVNLGFAKSSAFSKVLGFSESPGKLICSPNFRALRLASILHAVNENWGDLLCALTRGRLIDRKCFESSLVEKKFLKMITDIETFETRDTSWLPIFATDYAFLMSQKSRKKLFIIETDYELSELWEPPTEITYNVDRSNILDSFTRLLESEPAPKPFGPYIQWNFTFQGESGVGLGPTKEFYSEFSRDIQRHDLNLWIGDPEDANSTGSQYVRSESGLFLTPFISAKSKDILTTIGKVMAQSLLFKHQLDLNFSLAFYKCLFPNALGPRIFSLSDIIHVMPNLSGFVESLVDALREKRAIEEYGDSLTEEERTEALANITCDGCSFRDLEINFTFPGYPYAEMKEGGREVCLNIDNVEEYLKLLVWWLYHKYRAGFTYLWEELEQYGTSREMELFYPDEMESILCGMRSEQWSVRYLAEHCVVEDFPPDSPVPGYLFEVLSSLTEYEQSQFLMFVTSSKRLPLGGLEVLTPRLTVMRRGATGDPDLYLPSSMTCFNLLFLTEYTSKDRLREMLLLAIGEGANSFQFQ